MLVATSLDANGWAIIIGAIFMGVLQVLQMILSHLKGVQQAATASEVKQTLAAATEKHEENLKDVASKVEAVRVNSNGLTERLVETASKEAYARGLLDGQSKKGE